MATSIEIRGGPNTQVKSGGEGILLGHAALYDTPSKPLPFKNGSGTFTERIKRGAFDRCLRSNPDIRCLFNHDTNAVLGRTKSGTLKVWSDDRGLAFRCQLDRNQESHRALWSAVKRNDISDTSFAFATVPNGEEWTVERGQSIRTLTDVDVFDVSAVTHPAYEGPTVSARFQSDQTEIRQHIERWNKAHPNLRAVQALLKANYPLTVEMLDHAYRTRRPAELEDALNLMRSVAYGEKFLRESGAGVYGVSGGPRADLIGAGMPDSGASGVGGRQNLGQNEDPQQTLRFDWDDDEKWDREMHERCAKCHRDFARQVHSFAEISRHINVAGYHDEAARLYPYDAQRLYLHNDDNEEDRLNLFRAASRAARAASQEMWPFSDKMVS